MEQGREALKKLNVFAQMSTYLAVCGQRRPDLKPAPSKQSLSVELTDRGGRVSQNGTASAKSATRAKIMDALTSTKQPIIRRALHVRCCIVGGGPAGMMLGYLLGRAGVETLVLEKHADFFRDFRGNTVHPSTLQVMDELGLIDGFLKLPHQKLQKMEGIFGNMRVRIADLGRLNIKYPYIAFMPQWDFLNFLRESGKRFPSPKVMMNANATDLLWAGERVVGVKTDTPEGPLEIRAELTVGCDGRHSLVRQSAKLEIEEIGAPMDVLWFRAGRRSDESESVAARVQAGSSSLSIAANTGSAPT
jgi:FAD binding domain